MSFRRRITIVSAAAVAIAVVLASILTYMLTSNQLHSQVDTQLRERARARDGLVRALDAKGLGGDALERRTQLRIAAEKVLGSPPGAPPTGAAGATGATGAVGAASATGTSGAAGATGATGTSDAAGATGATGTSDAAGATGATGASDAPGATGAADSATDTSGAARRRKRTRSGSSTGNIFSRLSPGPDQVRGYQQVVNAKGTIVVRSAKGVSLPVNAATSALAAHGGEPFFRDADVNGIHLRVLAESLGKGHAVQFAQPLTEVDSLLARLRLILALLVVGGIALAAVLGRVVAGAAVQPLKRLTKATEHVALTRDLSGRIKPSGDDELGRLASSFNAMLDALELSISALDASVHAQRQLVADASHELRTPVTSLRTNIEILQQQGPDMDPDESRRLLSDVVEQIEELTLLMNDLIELARGEEPRVDAEELRLDLLVGEVVDRARRRATATPLQLQLEPTIVTGVPARLERAVGNLIDNAVKYSPPGAPVEIRLHAGELSVRDHGPGIATDDLPHIFDRFYRGAEARGRPGSGLGLAIVQQVAAQQGGSIIAAAAPGGGTLMHLHLPGTEAVDANSEATTEAVDGADGQHTGEHGELAPAYERS